MYSTNTIKIEKKATSRFEGMYCNSFNNYPEGSMSFLNCNEWKKVEGFHTSEVDTDGMSKIEKLVSLGIDTAIVIHSLKVLWSKGNQTAFELLNGHSGILSIEDLKQEVRLYLLENVDKWIINEDNQLEFTDDDIFKKTFGVVSHAMYQFQTKHYKKMYISIDNADIRIDDIQALAMYTDFESILTNKDIIAFMDTLTDTEKEYFKFRLGGASLRECAGGMNTTLPKIRTIDKHLKNKWIIWNK